MRSPDTQENKLWTGKKQMMSLDFSMKQQVRSFAHKGELKARITEN